MTIHFIYDAFCSGPSCIHTLPAILVTSRRGPGPTEVYRLAKAHGWRVTGSGRGGPRQLLCPTCPTTETIRPIQVDHTITCGCCDARLDRIYQADRADPRAARLKAREQGWFYGLKGERWEDLCPVCKLITVEDGWRTFVVSDYSDNPGVK